MIDNFTFFCFVSMPPRGVKSLIHFSFSPRILFSHRAMVFQWRLCSMTSFPCAYGSGDLLVPRSIGTFETQDHQHTLRYHR